MNVTFDSGETFTCSYGRATRVPISFRDECRRTAELISQQATAVGLTPAVLLSGGLDSEVLALSFLDAGVPFRCDTFRYPNDLNAHEISNVIRFCATHGIQTTFHDLDIYRWAFSKEAERLFFESQSAYFSLVPHMWLISRVHAEGGFPMLGNGEVLMERTEAGWCYTEKEFALAWERHAVQNGIRGAMGFYQHTAEISLAAALDPRNVQLGTGQNAVANKLLKESAPIKYALYRDHWPELIPRKKFGGAEYVSKFFNARTVELRARLPRGYNRQVLTPYAEFVALLQPEALPNAGG